MGTAGSALRRYSNILLIGTSVCAGIIFPQFGSFIRPFVSAIVILLIYSFLREFRFDKTNITSGMGLVIVSMGVSYVLLPVTVTYLATAFFIDPIVVGFVVLFSAPTTTVSGIWTRFSNGDVQLATTITVVSIMIAPVVTPAVLFFLVGSQMNVPVVGILTNLVFVVGGGVLLAVLVPDSMISDRTIDSGAMAALMIVIYASTATADIITVEVTHIVTIIGTSLLLLGFGAGISLAFERILDLSRAQTVPLFFSSNIKNLGVSLLIINHAYLDPLVVITVVTCFICQQLFSALITDYVS